MRLTSFSVRNYRSITDTQKLPLQSLTALIGRNNEGKSNILRALVVGMQLMSRHGGLLHFPRRGVRRTPIRTTKVGAPSNYDWERDFPKELQQASSKGKTAFNFVFLLDDSEMEEFKNEIKSTLNKDLPITIEIGAAGKFGFTIRKQGRGHKALNNKAEDIAAFIGSRIRIEYVPSIRTADQALAVVDNMVTRALAKAESSEEYKSALLAIERVQQPLLDSLSSTLSNVLREFLPEIKSARVEIAREDRHRALRALSRVLIDDGCETDMRMKGDGLQSLAALSLLRRAAQEASEERMDLLLAVEEPEAHLHPTAIHQLHGLLRDIAKRQQVILTTHSPLLVSRTNPAANIVVECNTARVAKSMAHIREVLGVRLADNLQSSRLVLVVEGSDDAQSIEAILKVRSNTLRNSLATGDLAIDDLGGASNLRYKISMYRAAAAQYYAFLDHDRAGLDAAEKAGSSGMLDPSERSFTIRSDMRESEFEDLLAPQTYRTDVESRWNVALQGDRFGNSRKKWSNRMNDVFRHHGQAWTDKVEAEVKSVVAAAVARNPANAIESQHSGPIDSLIETLERILKN